MNTYIFFEHFQLPIFYQKQSLKSFSANLQREWNSLVDLCSIMNIQMDNIQLDIG